ncbi:MAG: hypothetical protein AAGC57_16560 [Pseudomonadota bacterium]
MRRPLALLVATAILVPSVFAEAQSLRARQKHIKAEEQQAEKISSVNKTCGTEIEAGFDWDTFPDEVFKTKYSIPLYCEHPLEAMRNLCRSNDGDLAKEAISSKVSAVICQYGEERQMALDEGTMRYTIHFGTRNDYRYVYEWLLDNL